MEGDVSTSQSRGEKRKGEGGGKARGDADRLVKQEAVNGAPKSPGGSPGRWVSTRNKRKRLEEEDTKNQEKKTKRSTKTNQSGDRKDERRPSKKRKGASKGDGSKGSEVSGSVGGLKPSGSVSGPQPSDPSGRRKSSDQLWRLKRQHKVAKGPRAANFVGDGFVAGTVENEGGKNEKDEERDEEREREDGTEGAAAAVDGDMRENDGGREDALEIGGSKGGESEEQKSGGDASKDVSRADRRLRSRGKEIVQDREEEKYLKGGSRRKRGKEEGPVAGLADDMQQGKKRNGKLQGPVEDLRRRKKERRIDDLLVEDKSGTAGEESTETERKKLKKGREAKSGASKSETAPSEGGRKAPKSKTATDDERGANGASALGGDDVRKKGRVKEGDIIHREEASGPKVARYPRRRLRKKGELEHGVSGDNGAKEGGAEEKGGSGDGSNPTEAVDTLREDQRVTAVFENQGEEGAKPSDDAAEPSKEADAEEKRGDIDELAEGRGDEAAVVNASQEEGAEVDGEAATALGAGLNAEESGLVDKKEAPEESNRGADEAAEQLGMGIAGNDVARASVKKGAASIGEENGREASPEPNSEKVRAGLEAEQKTGGAKGSVADAQQGHVSEGQLGNVAEVGVVEERTILMGLVQTAEAGVGVASGEGPVYTEGKGPIHTSSAEALPTDDVPTGSLQSAIAKSAVPIPTGAAEPVATGGAGPVHNDGAGPVHTATEDELVDATGWTASQVAALKSALRMIDPTVDGLWYKVARQVRIGALEFVGR